MKTTKNDILKKHLVRITFILGIIGCLVWLYFARSWQPIIAIISFSSGFFVNLEGKIANLEGIWAYRVLRAGEDLGHAGRCKLTQNGNSVDIHGHRYISSQRDGSLKPIDWTWETVWGQIFADGQFKFEYEIIIGRGAQAERISGYCRVRISDDGREMDGNYAKLPPFKENCENTEFGAIYFYKLAKEAKLERPPEGYEKDGNERQLAHAKEPSRPDQFKSPAVIALKATIPQGLEA